MKSRTLYFIAMTKGGPNMYGGRPMFHKTEKGAARYAKLLHGKVHAFDLFGLPQVIDRSVSICAATSELEFAERQMLAWAAIADRIRGGECDGK